MATSNELIDAFCDQVWLQDGLAPSSLTSYRRDLTGWAAWLDRRGRSLLAAQRTDVEAFLADQFRAKAKATSIARRLSSLRRFYALQLLQGAMRADPTLRVRAPKLPRRLPKNLSEADVEALLAAPDPETTLGLRDRAMLETLYATGLRVSELVGLTLAQVSLDMGVVRVLGKGSKERLVPLGEESIGWVKRYLAAGRPTLIGSGKSNAVFVTARRGAAHAPGLLGARQAPCGQGRHTCREHLAARAAPCVRHAPPQSWRRPPRRPIAARPRRHHDDDDLHARRARAPEEIARAASSAGLNLHAIRSPDRRGLMRAAFPPCSRAASSPSLSSGVAGG